MTTKKNLEYWDDKFLFTPQEDIVSELQKDIENKDMESIAYAFLSVVRDMNGAEFREQKSNMFKIMINLQEINLLDKTNPTYNKTVEEYKNKNEDFRYEIEMFLEREPAMKKNIIPAFAWYQDKAKDVVLTNMTSEQKSNINLPDLTQEEVFNNII